MTSPCRLTVRSLVLSWALTLFPQTAEGQCTAEADSLVKEAFAAIEQRDATTGAAVTQTLVRTHPGCAETHHLVGTLLMIARRTAEAETSFSRAIELDSMLLKAYVARAGIRLVQQDLDGVTEDANWVLAYAEAVADLYQAHVLRVAVLSLTEDFEAVIEESQAMIAVDPDRAEAYQYLGQAHSRREEWNQAVAALTTSLERDPGDTDPDDVQAFRANSLGARGRARLELGEAAGAREDLDAAIRLAPEEGRAYFYRARLHLDGGRLDEARADLRLAIEHARNEEHRGEAQALLEQIG